ncbi:hypothetical protein [Bradyrhizobium sp.]|uniref:hypothetical protein n=1 Tax=Bradyrhizobium sp. TaxID=376 RepID=UPI00238DFFBE|nr:hypothetical protein [Bradyrhizobium sp.]MDE2378049.1 hypothetical protein [Bradyrhizobium sp.]
MSAELPAPVTTRFTRPVTTIKDIETLERPPYDALVPARSGRNIDVAAIDDVAHAFPGIQISSPVGMDDAARLRELADSLSTLPQTYEIKSRSPRAG